MFSVQMLRCSKEKGCNFQMEVKVEILTAQKGMRYKSTFLAFFFQLCGQINKLTEMVTHLSKFTCYQFIECVILFICAQVFLNYQQLNKLLTLLNQNIICLNLNNMFQSVMIYFSVRLLVKQKRSVLHW